MDLFSQIRITWPTILTFIRLGLIPFILFFITHQWWLLAAIFFSAAMVTDFFDGFVARKFHLTTKFGALLDGLADKLLMLTLFIVFLFFPSLLPDWFVWLVLIKELIMLCAAAILLQRKYVIIIAPLMLGKITMAAEMFLLLWMICSYQFSILFPPVVVNLVASLIVATLVGYFVMVLRLKRKHSS